MTASRHYIAVLLALAACRPVAPPAPPAPASGEVVPLSADEARMRDAVRVHYDSAVDLLRRAVNIPSGTGNLAGVRKVGDLFGAELAKLGFESRWVSMPDSMRRAGHLVASHRGGTGPRLLLIGHLDTVFEGAGQEWVQ